MTTETILSRVVELVLVLLGTMGYVRARLNGLVKQVDRLEDRVHELEVTKRD